MKAISRYLARLHQRLGAPGITFLMAPVLPWVWTIGKDPIISVFNGAVPRYVAAGKLFSESFDTLHAGMAMDQPTIGKWLFWFTFLTVTSLPYAAIIGWFGNRTTLSGRVAYAVCVLTLIVFLLCVISWPLCWLIQYVWSMGFTVRRVFGLVYACEGVVLLLTFLWWSWRQPKGIRTAATRTSTASEAD